MKMNMRMRAIYLVVIFLFLIQIVSAVPKIEPYVNDFANLLTPEEETQLNIQADIIEQNTTYEIAIVTVLDTEGEDTITYANKIGDENGVGKKGKDNGVVVLWSVEDGGAIATGRFSESILNDAKVVRIGKAARPYFDNQSYYLAFNHILNDIDSELRNKSDSISVSIEPFKGPTKNSGLFWFVVIIFGILIIFKIFDFGSVFGGIAIGSALKGIGSSSGGGKSFGGGSFGGAGGKF